MTKPNRRAGCQGKGWAQVEGGDWVGTGSSEASGGAGGISRGLKRKAAEAQSGCGEDDAENDNMLGGSMASAAEAPKRKGKTRGGKKARLGRNAYQDAMQG